MTVTLEAYLEESAILNQQAPETIHLNTIEPNRLALNPLSGESTYELTDTQTGQVLATVYQPEDCDNRVEFYLGKGGLTAILTSPQGLKYFALPGASMEVGGTRLDLPGDPITSNPGKASKAPARGQTQTHTRQAMILGAGLATRFEPVSGENTQYAKPAVPLAGERSVIRCIADGLKEDGFTEIIINTFFMPASLKAGLASAEGVRIHYIDEDAPSGTAGGLRKMLTLPQYEALLDTTRPLLVTQGDSVSDVNLSALVESHVCHGTLLTIGCQPVADKDVSKFGIIVTDQSDKDGISGNITGFQEKPPLAEAKSRLGNTGFYVIAPRAFPLIRHIYEKTLSEEQARAAQAGLPRPDAVLLDFANDIFPAVLRHVQANPADGGFRAQAVEGYWSDIGNPTQYLETIHELYAGKISLSVGQPARQFYRNGVIYWPQTQALADAEGAKLSGNIIVAKPFEG